MKCNPKKCENEYFALPQEERIRFLHEKGIREIVPENCDFSTCPIYSWEMTESMSNCQTAERALKLVSEKEQRGKVFQKIIK